MKELSEQIHNQITGRCEQANALLEAGQLGPALEELWGAWDLLPEAKTQWEAATFILGSIGDINFLTADFQAGRDNLHSAMHCPDAVGNAFLHFRLGQCEFELGEHDNAAQELARAYLAGGVEVFRGSDPKYYDYLQTRLEPPPNGWDAL